MFFTELRSVGAQRIQDESDPWRKILKESKLITTTTPMSHLPDTSSRPCWESVMVFAYFCCHVVP